MKADRPLWIDDKGRLCDAPPSSGIKIAGVAGFDIPQRFVDLYALDIKAGRVVQKGREPISPKSTPDAIVADRDLWIDSDGALSDDPIPEGSGIKIASKGEPVSSYYVKEHGLAEKDGQIVQTKAVKKAENKAVESAPNKSAKADDEEAEGGGLTVTSKAAGGRRSSKRKG